MAMIGSRPVNIAITLTEVMAIDASTRYYTQYVEPFINRCNFELTGVNEWMMRVF